MDGAPSCDLNIGLKNYAENTASLGNTPETDLRETSKLAAPHIGTDTLPLARRYVRCYELLEHGFYSEAFIVAFSLLDDFVQAMLEQLLKSKGVESLEERKALLRGIKDNRLKIFLGPVLKLVFGRDIETMWPASTQALKWLNERRNGIAHRAEQVDYAPAAWGIYACLKVVIVMKENGATPVDINVELFRYAKITAAWTSDPPSWVPSGEISESMDFRS